MFSAAKILFVLEMMFLEYGSVFALPPGAVFEALRIGLQNIEEF